MINVPQDGVRTFLPLQPCGGGFTPPFPRPQPAITRPARHLHYTARVLSQNTGRAGIVVRKVAGRSHMRGTPSRGNRLCRSRLALQELWDIGKRRDRRPMNQTLKIVVKDSNYPIVRLFMWVALASAAMMFIALWLSKWILVGISFALLLIAQRAGAYFNRKRLHDQGSFRCQKCGQPVDLQQALSTALPDDRVARCPYRREPFGKF